MDSSERDAGSEREKRTHLSTPDHGGRHIVVENVLKGRRVLGRGGREARQGKVALRGAHHSRGVIRVPLKEVRVLH